MLRKLRIAAAVVMFAGITLLFLDISGVLHSWLGWMAKVQLLPAVLALNVGVIAALLVVTLLLGRVYCSVICPLGVFQDVVSWLSGLRSKRARARFSYSAAKTLLRLVMLALLIVGVVFGVGILVALLAPYSTYGRFVQSALQPLWIAANNALAAAEGADSYTFAAYPLWVRSVTALVLSVGVVALIAVLAWRSGRTWCNTVCPVGTVLGYLSRFSLLKPVINTDKCVNCGLCARRCKASCIDAKGHKIDYTRCVTCFDCLEACHTHAISYTRRSSAAPVAAQGTDTGRRAFLAGTGIALAAGTVAAAEKTTDGGLATILDKQAPKRAHKIVPPGALSVANLEARCTACQLCVSECPNEVLRPSGDLLTFMQPYASYERGYCRPECTACSQVCPTGAILPIDAADKSSIQVGHAVWVRQNCLVLTEEVACGNCARHCPTGAIAMIPSVPGDDSSPRIPAVNEEICIGCGACELYCPSRPFSAIYVEGHEQHKTI